MNLHHNIAPEEWDLIETWMDQKDVQGETLFLNKKLVQITNILQKIGHVKKVREEIEDSIRQAKIKEFHKYTSVDLQESGIDILAHRKIHSKAIWLTIAAALAVLFGIFWMMDKSNKSEKLFAKNFKPDIGLPLKMSNTSTYGFYEGMLDYKQENYTAAIAKWQVLLQANPENDTLNYFLGVTNLAIGDVVKSMEYLQNQERFQQGIFKEDAAWYAALAKIKEGKSEEAEAFLKNSSSVRNKKLFKELDK